MDTTKLYHGTSVKRARRIRRLGISPRTKRGRIYFFSNLRDALDWSGESAVEVTIPTSWATLEYEGGIPKSVGRKLQLQNPEWVVRREIPPTMVTGVYND